MTYKSCFGPGGSSIQKTKTRRKTAVNLLLASNRFGGLVKVQGTSACDFDGFSVATLPLLLLKFPVHRVLKCFDIELSLSVRRLFIAFGASNM
jgi:hypothetical protein